MIESIATGVAANYLFTTLNSLAPPQLKRIFPAAFHGSPQLLTKLDKQLDRAKSRVVQRYRDYQTISIFFNEHSLSKSLVLKPILDHFFRGIRIDRKSLWRDIESCLAYGEEITDGVLRKSRSAGRNQTADSVKFRREEEHVSNRRGGVKVDTIIDDIIEEVRACFFDIGDPGLLFVINAAVSELRRSIDTIKVQADYESIAGPIQIEAKHRINNTLRVYHEYICENSKNLIIHGLNVVAKDDQAVRHILENAFVPLTLHTVATNRTIDPETDEWRGNATRVLKTSPFVILRGHAGCGKTTLMQWYIINSNIFSKTVKKSNGHYYTPIYIPLRRLEARINFDWSLADLMRASIPNESIAKEFSLDWTDAAVRAGHTLTFLLDGIDEISESNREKFWKLTNEIRSNVPSARIVITSRHLSAVHLASGTYRDISSMDRAEFRHARAQWSVPEGFLEFVMSPLNATEIDSFIVKWHQGIDQTLLTKDEIDKIDEYADNLKFLLLYEEGNPVAELCRTPLLCGLICLVHFIQNGRLPTSRRQLYEIASKILAKVRDEHRDVVDEAGYARMTLADRLGLLRHVALTMQEGANPENEAQTIEAEKKYVKEWARSWLDEHSFQDLDEEMVIRKLVERSNLLREPGVGKIDFLHRSFMEFLAANELVLRREPYVIRKYIDNDQWWSTLQFCMDTETGGSYFAGELLEIIVEYILHEKQSRRSLLLKIPSLIAACTELPRKTFPTVGKAFDALVPPQNWEEVESFCSFPFETFHGALAFDQVPYGENKEIKRLCAALLSRHHDQRCAGLILTGYQNEEDVEVIEWINRSWKISTSAQYGLIQRVRNGSYAKTVLLRWSDIGADWAIELRPRKIWLRNEKRLKVLTDLRNFEECSSLTLESFDSDFFVDVCAVAKKRSFRKVVDLRLIGCDGIKIEDVALLFPNLRTLEVDRCKRLNWEGLREAMKLEVLHVVHVRDSVKFSDQTIPMTLKSLTVAKSIDVEVRISKDRQIRIEES